MPAAENMAATTGRAMHPAVQAMAPASAASVPARIRLTDRSGTSPPRLGTDARLKRQLAVHCLEWGAVCAARPYANRHPPVVRDEAEFVSEMWAAPSLGEHKIEQRPHDLFRVRELEQHAVFLCRPTGSALENTPHAG